MTKRDPTAHNPQQLADALERSGGDSAGECRVRVGAGLLRGAGHGDGHRRRG